MADLAKLRIAFEFANAEFERMLHDRFPGADRWTWYRALAAIKGKIVDAMTIRRETRN